MTFLREFWRKGKRYVNYLLDRILDLMDAILAGTRRLPWMPVQRVARAIGNLCWLLRDLPRLDAWKLVEDGCTIVFVGHERTLPEVRQIFFATDPEQHALERVPLWSLAKWGNKQLAEGSDLVICEVSSFFPWQLKAPYTFSTPTWIRQIYALPEPIEELISGPDSWKRTIRTWVHRGEREGFGYRFSRDKADFHHFHYEMYLPLVTSRYGDRALVSSYQAQWQHWMGKGGGLLLITQGERTVAGTLCYLSQETCHVVEVGILGADPSLIKRGIRTIADWYLAVWARQQGARWLDQGGSRSWCSDGVFRYKKHWGARVRQHRKITSTWRFLARGLTPALQQKINDLGFISEQNGQFYRVLLGSDEQWTKDDLQMELLSAEKDGISGVCLVAPNRGLRVLTAESAAVVTH